MFLRKTKNVASTQIRNMLNYRKKGDRKRFFILITADMNVTGYSSSSPWKKFVNFRWKRLFFV